MRQALYAVAAFFMTLVPGCGQPVCFVGLGDCEKMFSNAPSTSSSNGTLTISGLDSVTTSTRPTYTATNGNGSYTWSVVSPSGCGNFASNTSGVFTPLVVGSCTIQVTDSSSPTAKFGTKVITITQ